MNYKPIQRICVACPKVMVYLRHITHFQFSGIKANITTSYSGA